MSLLSNNKKDAKKGKKNAIANVSGGKFSAPAKTVAPPKKAMKTGGTRGS